MAISPIRLIRYQPNRAGMRALAKSGQMDSMLERRARRVAQVAQAGFDAHLPHTGRITVDVVQEGSDSDRARVAVIARHPAAIAIEARHRILGAAINAVRG